MSFISDASVDEQKKEQSSQIGNTSWCQCGKCDAIETEGESLCCQVTNEIPGNISEVHTFQVAVLKWLENFRIKLIYTVLFLILLSGHKYITEMNEFQFLKLFLKMFSQHWMIREEIP